MLQTWDVAGYREATETFPRADGAVVSVKPGGEAVAVVSLAVGVGETASVFGIRDAARLPLLVFPGDSALGVVKARAFSASADVLVHANDQVALLWDIWAGRTRTIDLAGALHDVSVAAVSPGGQFVPIYGKNSEEKKAIAVFAVQGDAGARPKIVMQDTVHEMSSPGDDEDEDFELGAVNNHWCVSC